MKKLTDILKEIKVKNPQILMLQKYGFQRYDSVISGLTLLWLNIFDLLHQEY